MLSEACKADLSRAGIEVEMEKGMGKVDIRKWLINETYLYALMHGRCPYFPTGIPNGSLRDEGNEYDKEKG